MPDSREPHQALEAFISDVFPLGKAAGKGLDFLADAGQTPARADIIAFLQSQEVQGITERYLADLRALWVCLENKEIPVVLAGLPAQEPESEIQTERPVPPEFPAESENPLDNTSPPDASPAVEPLSSPSPMLPLAASAASSALPPTASSPQPVPVPERPQGSAPVDHALRPGKMPPANAPLTRPVDPRIRFHLPNAKAGQAYAGKLEGRDASEKAVTILDALADTATGLLFDAPSCELRGTPAAAGDYAVSVRWTLGGGTAYTSECLLFVNPDPRSLWKQIDPPADDPYFKPNTDAALIEGQEFNIAAASRRGRSHEHVGSFRDDDFFIHHDAPSGWSVLMVADGAGSAKNSRWGSKLAVAAAGNHIVSKLSGEFGAGMSEALAGWSSDMAAASKAMHTPFYRLFQEASRLAVESIEQEAKSKGVAPKEYATTLLAAAVRRDGANTFLATFWMGDGAIAAYGPRSKVRLMGTPDSGEFAGQTRFLDHAALKDPGFGKRLVLGRYADLAGVIVMTDGISDPRFETDNGLADAAKWDALWDEISPLLAGPEPQNALLEWLNFFTPGHHDDRTLAVLW